MGKFGNTNQSLIRHDYKRACYRAMLSELPIEEVKEYFAQVPLIIDGREVKGTELYRLLWSEKGKVPLCYDYGLDNVLEPFLVSKGRDVTRVTDKILWLNNKSTYMPGKLLLTWFYPKLESLFNSIDTRDMVFPLITLFTESWLPNHVHRRIKKWEVAEWTYSIMVYISDPTFQEYLDWDMDFIARTHLKNARVI